MSQGSNIHPVFCIQPSFSFSSSNRQTTLQESLDRLLLFHKNMITALTWLSSAESKVADLDSIVDASQTIEEQIEMDELHKELSVSIVYVTYYFTVMHEVSHSSLLLR